MKCRDRRRRGGGKGGGDFGCRATFRFGTSHDIFAPLGVLFVIENEWYTVISLQFLRF